MPSWEFIQDMVVPALLHMVLPAFAAAALVMAAAEWIGGARQASAGAALALCVGAVCGLWVYRAAPLPKDSLQIVLTALDNALHLDHSTWDRLPWAILAALCVGRLAHMMDVLSSDGWLLRGGAAIAIAWLLLPERERDEFVWLAPAFAATMAALWIVLDHLATQPGSGSVAVGVVLSLLVAAQLVLQAGCASFMDALVVLAFAFTGVALMAWRRGGAFGGAIPAIAIALPALLLMGQRTTESELPWFTFALPACAPLLLAVALPLSHWPKPLLHLVRLVLVLAVLAVALWYAPPDFSGAGIE